MKKQEISPYLIVATSKGQAIFTKEELFELYTFYIFSEGHIISEILLQERLGHYKLKYRYINEKNIDKFGATIKHHEEWNTNSDSYWFIDQKEYEHMVKESEQIIDKTQNEIEELKGYIDSLTIKLNRLKNINSENKLKK